MLAQKEAEPHELSPPDAISIGPVSSMRKPDVAWGALAGAAVLPLAPFALLSRVATIPKEGEQLYISAIAVISLLSYCFLSNTEIQVLREG